MKFDHCFSGQNNIQLMKYNSLEGDNSAETPLTAKNECNSKEDLLDGIVKYIFKNLPSTRQAIFPCV